MTFMAFPKQESSNRNWSQKYKYDNVLRILLLPSSLFLVYTFRYCLINFKLFIKPFFYFYTEEEISNMRKELEKYGIQMPSFSKIGGILASELSVDEAACKSTEQSEELYYQAMFWRVL